IKDVHLFDVRSGTMLANRTILIKEDRIVSIGTPDAPIRMPMLSKTIEGEGRYVIPGPIDAHSHLIFVLDSVGINGEDALHFYLANGVTSVRDIGDETIGQKRLVDYADKHPDISPSVFMCSPLIDGRHPYHGDDPVSIPITNPAQ